MNNINGESRTTDTHVYFWNGIYSQWHTTKNQFVENGITYPNAEKYMMMEKAKVFGATDIYEKMKNENSPKIVKALGRKIKNFSDNIWDEHKMKVVARASFLKFTQNPDLLRQLIADKDKTLVEASPVDKVWGIGIHYDNDDVLTESKWNGQYLRGKCIMIARNEILKKEDTINE